MNVAKTALEKAEDHDIFDGGRGTKEKPWQIESKETFLKFAASVKKETVNEVTTTVDYQGKYIELTKDIDLSGGEWTPIGEGEVDFAGSFDGNNHTIKGMTIGNKEQYTSLSYAGLFGTIADGAEIRNLQMTEVSIYAAPESNSIYVGAICGQESGFSAPGTYISHCEASGSIYVEGTAMSFVGGLVGYTNTDSLITDSGTDLSIYVDAGTKNVQIGGITGMEAKTIHFNNYALGDIYGTTTGNKKNMGGICGNGSGLVYNSFASGNLSCGTDAEGNPLAFNMGGITGQMTGGVISNSETDVVLNGVSDASWAYVGGISGVPSFCLLVNNIANGSITGEASQNKASLGGVAGMNACVTYNCVANVDIESTKTTSDVGGLAGRNTGIGMISNSYYLGERKQKNGNVMAADADKVPYGMSANEAIHDLEKVTSDNREAILEKLNKTNVGKYIDAYGCFADWSTGDYGDDIIFTDRWD